MTTHLAAEAIQYIREQLRVAAESYGGPLAARLRHLDLGTPFALLSPKVVAGAPDLTDGLPDDVPDPDLDLAEAVARWLAGSDPGHERMLVLEEPLGRAGNPAVHAANFSFETRVYWAATPGASADYVLDRLQSQSPYPGIGVLTRIPAPAEAGPVLDAAEFAALTDGAVAVLVRAWDAEAFVIAPVGDRLGPEDLAQT